MLMDRGLVRVRPLEGGLDAWSAAGYAGFVTRIGRQTEAAT